MNKTLQYRFIKCKPVVETIEVFIYVRESLFYQQYKKYATPVCTYIQVILRRLEMSKSSVQYDLYIKVLKLRYTKYSTEILKYFY